MWIRQEIGAVTFINRIRYGVVGSLCCGWLEMEVVILVVSTIISIEICGCAKIMIFAHRAEEGDQTQKLLETDINRIWITTKPCPPPTKTVFGIEKMHQP